MILFFSRSFISHAAIKEMGDSVDAGNVFCFDNRVEFLACATLLTHASLILDTVSAPLSDIHWLVTKLKVRKLNESLYFIVRSEWQSDKPTQEPALIRSLLDLHYVIKYAKDTPAETGLKGALMHSLNEKLSISYQQLIDCEINGEESRENYISLHGRKSYLNRRYQLKTKLNLKTLHEYNHILLMISNASQASAEP